jgi:hypothetical protein
MNTDQNYEITPFLMVFVIVYIHFRIWTRIRIRNPLVTDPDPAKVSDPDPQHWSNVSVSGKNHIQLNKQFCKICPDMQVVIFEIFIKKKLLPVHFLLDCFFFCLFSGLMMCSMMMRRREQMLMTTSHLARYLLRLPLNVFRIRIRIH